jgi:hypothetical protein
MVALPNGRNAPQPGPAFLVGYLRATPVASRIASKIARPPTVYQVQSDRTVPPFSPGRSQSQTEGASQPAKRRLPLSTYCLHCGANSQMIAFAVTSSPLRPTQLIFFPSSSLPIQSPLSTGIYTHHTEHIFQSENNKYLRRITAAVMIAVL